LILDSDKRNVTTAGLTTTKMQVAVDAQTIKNLIANYSRPHESCIRELCVNAYEAHFLAGKPDEPFLVHMPTKLEPWFAIQDFGIGMSENEIHELYSVIGKSSKRGSNDLTGAFGVGSKAAYAVTNIFTIQSCYNGKRFSYICHLDKVGIPCLSEAPNNGLDTKEPNGFTVKFDVPSSEYHRFTDGLKPALAHFKVKPEISGHNITWDKVDVAIEGKGYKIHTPKNRYDNKTYTVIMGQIGYPVEVYQLGYGHQISNNFGFDIEVAIGAVDINSSRETLQYNEKTKSAIIEAHKKMMADVQTKVDGLIDSEDCGWNKGVKSKTFSEMFNTKVRNPPVFDNRKKVKFRAFLTAKWNSLHLKEIKGADESGGIRFILDDLPRGSIVRCEDLRTSMGDTLLIPADQEKQALIDFGILPKHLIKASSIKRVAAKRTPQQKNTEKIQKLKRNETSHVTYCWMDVDPINVQKEALYCDLSRHGTTLNGKPLSPLELNQLLDFIGLYNKQTYTIYGVRKGGKPEKGWKSLQDFINKECEKHIPTYVKEVEAPYIPTHEYNELSKILDLSSVNKTTRRRDHYGPMLKTWFTLPKVTVEENSWELLMQEAFFYSNFSYDLKKDTKHLEAFKLLCKEYVTSFKLLEKK
tara:strand:- start:2728 stop:4641 length:1914 start_codon:yes stop_codon:yes gene_type:complete